MYGNDAGIRNKRKAAGAGIPVLLLVFWIGMPGVLLLGKRDNNLRFGMTHTGIAKNGSADTAVFLRCGWN